MGFYNIREWIKNASLSDNRLFAIALKGDTEYASFLVNTILGRDDIKVKDVHTQEEFPPLMGHSVIFDMLAEDKDGNLINVEMQKADIAREKLEARCIYYLSILNGLALKKGEKYRKAKDKIVIFIMTKKDVIGPGKSVYRFSFFEETERIRFGKGNLIVVANATCRDNINLGLRDLYLDLKESRISLIRTEETRKVLNRVKGSEGIMKTEYTLSEMLDMEIEKEVEKRVKQEVKAKIKALKEAEAIKKAKAKETKNTAEIARNMLKNNLSKEIISSCTGLSIKEVDKLAKGMEL